MTTNLAGTLSMLSNQAGTLFMVSNQAAMLYVVSNQADILEAKFPCGFGMSRIESLRFPACCKRRLMEASWGLPVGSIPSVVNV